MSPTSRLAVTLAGKKPWSIPLSEPLPGFPKIIYPVATANKAETRVTVLSNGLRVASEEKFGPYCIAGVAIKSGSRFETDFSKGVSHFIERISFRSTKKFDSRESIIERLSEAGGTLDCQGSRDTLIYATSIVKQHLETSVEILSEAVLNPRLTTDEIKDVAMRVNFENENLNMDPERKLKLSEMIHNAAYAGNTLGLPKLCPLENISKIDRNIMLKFMNTYHTPDRMVLAGVGVEHEKLVELANKYFLGPLNFNQSNVDDVKSIYTGGCKTEFEDLSNVSLGPNPLPNLAHFQLGFEVCSHLDLDDFVIVCVMNMLMGGGGSFSAGGPGKGMFTRLFTNVLNRYHWIHSCSAQNSSYDDSGLFYIQSSSEPSRLKDLVDVVINELLTLAYDHIHIDDLQRAKRQLISMLWLNLEVRPVVFEDIARQVLTTGFRRQPKQIVEKIEEVSENDIKRIASKMLEKNPSVACLGDLTRLPSFEYIKNRIQNK